MVSFDPVRIIKRAQQVADHDLNLAITGELELIELSDLEVLVGVKQQLIPKKLSHSEIAEGIFVFRKVKLLSATSKHRKERHRRPLERKGPFSH
jgi:hypothetical protein